jgi:hypothetical protein
MSAQDIDRMYNEVMGGGNDLPAPFNQAPADFFMPIV